MLLDYCNMVSDAALGRQDTARLLQHELRWNDTAQLLLDLVDDSTAQLLLLSYYCNMNYDETILLQLPTRYC